MWLCLWLLEAGQRFSIVLSCSKCYCLLSHAVSHMKFSITQVREQGQQKGEASPYLTDLLRLEEQAKQQGVGRWNMVCIYISCLCILVFEEFLLSF